jgi:cysteine and glycine-rich protein
MSSNKCPSCAKSVYKVEEILCAGGAWHKECFKCGGVGDLGCQRKLNPSDFKSHAAVPYCKGCYMQAISKPAVVVAGDVAAVSSSEKVEVPNLSSSGKVADRPMSVSVGGKSVLGSRLFCPKCTKTVFKAEEIQLAGYSWHKSCFTCGGASETDGCKRTLNAQDFHPHRGNPFCKGCIGKQTLVKKMESSMRIDTESSETAALEPAAEVKESPIQKIQVPKIFGAPSPSAHNLVESYDKPASSTKEMIRRDSSREAPREAPRSGSKGDIMKESQKTSQVSHAEPAAAAATAAAGSAVNPRERDAAPAESPAVSAASSPVIAASAPVVAIASPTSTHTIATVVAIDGRPKDVEREETAEHEDIETTYQDENGVPCTKDGEPLNAIDSVTLNSDSSASGESTSTSYSHHIRSFSDAVSLIHSIEYLFPLNL